MTHATLDTRWSDRLGCDTRKGRRIEADLFVDCTGFAGLLIDKALRTPFVSFASNLFNDAAVALPSPIGRSRFPRRPSPPLCEHGWAWKIPLTSRYGNGYVYSTQFCSPDAAETELRQHLGLLESDAPARHLKMKIGRVTRSTGTRTVWRWDSRRASSSRWRPRRCSSSSRPRPCFWNFWSRAIWARRRTTRFNQRVNDHFEGTRDYIVTHYKTNTSPRHGVLACQCRESQPVG